MNEPNRNKTPAELRAEAWGHFGQAASGIGCLLLLLPFAVLALLMIWGVARRLIFGGG